jgi:hypothetical protein
MWPSCNAPIVGTKPIFLPLCAANSSRKAFTVETAFIFGFNKLVGAKIQKQTKNEKRKTENFQFFGFRLEWKNGNDAKPRAETACRLCLGAKEEKPALQD